MLKHTHAVVTGDQLANSRFVLKIAETRADLEACFAILHDAYVDNGLMKPDPSGIRLNVHHALPTTTTICATFDGAVIGTVSLIRESPLGVPLQRIFDLTALRTQDGCIAEVSALAVRKDFRKTGGSVLLPMMKFLADYCTTHFNTRHLLIAVNPRHIRHYESLLCFRRLPEKMIASYDFVNGAPAIGAALDLKEAMDTFRAHYAVKWPRSKFHRYFTQGDISDRRHAHDGHHRPTRQLLLTPDLLDYFFNVRTRTFARLGEAEKALLHSIYDRPEYKAVLPPLFKQRGNNPSRSLRLAADAPIRGSQGFNTGLMNPVAMRRGNASDRFAVID